MDKYLIINADDFGMCHSANVATMELFKNGGITSATLMAPCAWAKEAGDFARDNPQFCVGVHLTFTSEWNVYKWSPVGDGANASLRAEDGYFHAANADFAASSTPEEVENEILAQIARARSFGFAPSHLDNHMGSLLSETYLPLVLRVCAENGYPFRLFKTFEPGEEKGSDFTAEAATALAHMGMLAEERGVPVLDRLIIARDDGPQAKSYEAYREYMLDEVYANVKDGISEIFIHPSIFSDEIAAITDTARKRSWEYALHNDARTKKHIESIGVKLIDWRDLKAMRNEM